MSLSEKIKILRKEKGWSQYQLGEKVGVHEKHVSKWENGKVIPGSDALKKLVELFKVSSDYLLFDNVPRNEHIKFTDPEIVEQLEKIEKLANEDRDAIKRVIRAMVKNQKIKNVIKD
ncbi:MAG: helix-turn-helix domain-containing protein [bacterium]